MNNKFGRVDPTHYRQFLLVLQLHAKGCSMFVELQVHHKDIKAHNDGAHSHDHYEFFRADLGGRYWTGDGGTKDHKQAEAYYQKACDAGLREGCSAVQEVQANPNYEF